MKIIFSINTHLAKLLERDSDLILPRIPSDDGQRIGTQALVTDAQQVSWQCNLVREYRRRKGFHVIAVEAYSRYTLLLPFSYRPTVVELEREILRRWANELISLMVMHGAVTEEQADQVVQQYMMMPRELSWYCNTDLSVNGHIIEAGHWLDQFRTDYGVDLLSEDDAEALGFHINELSKKAKKGQGSGVFYPVPRFVDDGLYRFAKGLRGGRDFACPYELPAEDNKPLPDNVISMADFRRENNK